MRLGVGRINPVDHLFNTHFLIEQFAKLGIDLKSLTDEQIVEITKLLTNNINYAKSGEAMEITAKKLCEIIKIHVDGEPQMLVALQKSVKDNTYFNGQIQRFSGKRFSIGASYLGQYFIPISGGGDLTSTFSYNLAFEIGQSVTKNLHFNVSLSTGVEAFKPNCCDVGAESFEFQWSGRLNGQLKYYFSPRYMIGLNNDILVVKDNFINRASIMSIDEVLTPQLTKVLTPLMTEADPHQNIKG